MGNFLMASEILTLNNDVKSTMIYEGDTHLPIVSMQVVFEHSGSIADGDKAGLAKVVARMLGEGTKSLGSIAFAESLESKAIHLSASNGSETFVFELSSLKSEFKDGIKSFEALLKDPNFTQETLEKVVTKMKGSLLQKENDFDYIAAKELKDLIFEGTPLANPASGTLKSLESITLKDVEDFYKSHMVQNRAVAVVGGDLLADEANSYVSTLLNVLPKGEKASLATIGIRKDNKEVVVKKDTKQAFVYFASPLNVKVDDKDGFKARVAIYILGTGGFGSRLMEEIRVKRGLAYSVYARASVNKSNTHLTGYLQTKLETGKEALDLVKAEFEKFVNEGVTQKELDGAKAFLLGSEPLRTETLSQRLSRTFMNYYKGLALDSSIQELKSIEALSLNDLNDYIKEHKEILDLSVVTVTK
jgi:zinc protease